MDNSQTGFSFWHHYSFNLIDLFAKITKIKANKIYVLIPDPVIDRFVNFGEHVKCILKIYFSTKIQAVNNN